MIYRRVQPSSPFHDWKTTTPDDFSSGPRLPHRKTAALSSSSLSKQHQIGSNDAVDCMDCARKRLRTWRFVLVVAVGFVMALASAFHLRYVMSRSGKSSRLRSRNASRKGFFPADLLKASVYKDADLVNERGIKPPYWDDSHQQNKTTTSSSSSSTVSWGPCFPLSSSHVNWNEAIQKYRTRSHQRQQHEHVDPTTWFDYTRVSVALMKKRTPPSKAHRKQKQQPTSLAGFCRPGFLIIGAGKCGTSSLYHYLVGHPRVAPASEKQIHYFRYFAERPMAWYLSHFPSTTSFLASGALITGEASPGYLPYPDVAHLVASRLSQSATDNGNAHTGGPKILVVGRNPLERTVSSYLYNYVGPAITFMRLGAYNGIPNMLPRDQDYEPFLFSLEDLLRAELDQLKDCLAVPNGSAVEGARIKWSQPSSWAKGEFDRRSEQGLPPLADLDGHCYGNRFDATTPRRQWRNLVKQHPSKLINVPHLHLVQALLGRSLYVLALEWWYVVFPPEDIYFVCTEELRDKTGESMNQVGQFLGLPPFNFSTVVQRGVYNVGGHQGYDQATPWEQVEMEAAPLDATTRSAKAIENSTTGAAQTFASLLTLSDDFRRELDDFIKPYNERLFQLVGRRCNW